MENHNNHTEFECNICLSSAHNPIVTECGHLYCWACIYQWLNTNRTHLTCPVCKSGISEDNVIPVFTKGKRSEETMGNEENGGEGTGIPPRPRGRRREA